MVIPRRIKLPPETVLQNIQASAIRDRDAYAAQLSETNTSNSEGEEEIRVVTRTWRDARYEEILELKAPSENQHKRRKAVGVDESLEMISRGLRQVMLPSGLISSSSSSEGRGASLTSSSVEASAGISAERGAGGGKVTKQPQGKLEMGKGAKSEGVGMDFAVDSTEQGSSVDYSDRREGYWEWMTEFDELSMMMRQGLVLCGFIEAPITFPPSFKWKCKAHAGDFTDMDTLKGWSLLRACIECKHTYFLS